MCFKHCIRTLKDYVFGPGRQSIHSLIFNLELYNLSTMATAAITCLNCQNNLSTMASWSTTDSVCKTLFPSVKGHQTWSVRCTDWSLFLLSFCFIDMFWLICWIGIFWNKFCTHKIHDLHPYFPIMANSPQQGGCSSLNNSKIPWNN